MSEKSRKKYGSKFFVTTMFLLFFSKVPSTTEILCYHGHMHFHKKDQYSSNVSAINNYYCCQNGLRTDIPTQGMPVVYCYIAKIIYWSNVLDILSVGDIYLEMDNLYVDV